MKKFLLKLFVSLYSIREAVAFSNVLATKLEDSGLSSVKVLKVEPYWKIKEYIEITIQGETAIPLKNMLTIIGEGWSILPSGGGIWVESESSTCINNHIKWMHWEVI